MSKKKILITGTNGFIFSNFLKKVLLEESDNYTFIGIDKLVNNHSFHNFVNHSNYKFYIGDIADEHFIDSVFKIEKPDIIINGCSETFVDSSIFNAKPFIKTNVFGTQVLADASVKYGAEKFVQVSCYDDKTRALTRNGFKFWHELSLNDVVLSLNPITHEIEEKQIEKIIVQDYEGDLLHFNNGRINLKVTPNHRFLCTDNFENNNKDSLSWATAEELEITKNKYYLPHGKINKLSLDKINIKGIGEVDAQSLFYVCGVFIADGFTAYQEKISENKTGYSKKELNKISRDPKTGRFFKIIERGLKATSISHSYRIYFDVPENDKARIKLELALTKLNINYHAQKNKSGEHIYFSSKEWMNLFDTFGKYAKNKHIPDWMLSHGTVLLECLWRGIHDGDGHGFEIKGRTAKITSISNKLIDQLHYLGQMLGCYTASSYIYKESFINERKISGWAFDIRFPDERCPLLPKPNRIPYKGKVWCLTIPDNKNFIVERDGKLAICGNTDEVYGQLKLGEPSWTEKSNTLGRNPYSISKLAGELVVYAANQTHNLQYNITRCCNILGENQLNRNLIPKTISCIFNNKPIPIHNDGSQLREWLYVEDKCDAILHILKYAPNNEIYNIGSGKELTTLEMVNYICDYLGKGKELITFGSVRKGFDFRYSVNTNKIHQLGWQPKFTFDQGMKKCIDWYVENKWYLDV